jgi:hypothetical protein
MESIASLKDRNSVNSNINRTDFKTDRPLKEGTNYNPAIIKMVAEGGENFFRYLKRVNLSRESDILVLPSREHYYYEENELDQFRTIINLKKLNHIKYPGKFLNNLTRILPDNVNFIGCFSVDQTNKGNGIMLNQPSKLLKRFINLIDSKTDHNLNKKEVSELLLSHGFKVVDMTEMNGIIYFYSQNVRQHVELMAS